MRTMTVIFTTLILVVTVSGSGSDDVDQTELIGPPPAYEEVDSGELIGPPPSSEEERKSGGTRCMACH